MSEPIQEPNLAVIRTLVRHERGTLLVLISLLAVIIGHQTWYLFHLWGMEQLYSTPDIYREQTVQLMWGKHGK